MKKNPKCSLYDLRALEVWLAELAAEGLELTDDWQEFREGEKQEKQFYIEPAEENGEPSQSLRDSRALMGWEYVCSMEKNAFYIWRSTGKAASPPRARELTGGWADRRLGQKLLWWWLGVLASPLMIAAYAYFFLLRSGIPVWTLLTDGSGQLTILMLLLGIFCGFWATRREHRDLRRLRRAVRAGEYEKPVAQHTVWYELMRWLPVAISVLLLLPYVRSGEGRTAWDHPFLTAEALGGEAGDRYAETRDTPLCDLLVVQEGHFAEFDISGSRSVYDTQLEVYSPRFGLLSGELTQELARHFNMVQGETLDGMETYYSAADGVQRALLRRGGTVLLYRTDAPDDLNLRMEELAALAEAYY